LEGKTIKALFLDFYGTIVNEDDEVITGICNEIKDTSSIECDTKEIGRYWWKILSKKFIESYGSTFEAQRILELKSLNETIIHFQSDAIGEEIVKKQYEYWQKPGIFKDSVSFIRSIKIPVYVLSNIDTEDVLKAIEFHHLEVQDVITSEDVRAYKPRSEMFLEALSRYRLDKSEVLHVGDSLSSDIQGAQNVGIKAVWINRKHKDLPNGISPDYICHDLEELKKYL
jgi:2-haloalkanoic acid dehalogenase type II